jgi:N-acetylglucosaminyldiphosphoundecaprenol N-acetyl-beta-D-mannosaminyltransferase
MLRYDVVPAASPELTRFRRIATSNVLPQARGAKLECDFSDIPPTDFVPPRDLPAREEQGPDLAYNLGRDVYCILGLPLDSVDMAAALERIGTAAAGRNPFLISTANLNFLTSSLADPDFREALLSSDLCTADGMPVLWIARLLGIRLGGRVAGSDVLTQLGAAAQPERPLSVFLFGGPDGVADTACRALNARSGEVRCAGALDPGYGSATELSSTAIIDRINASGADFLAVALGAAKGQAWLRRNHECLRIPVRVHLGAAIKFLAGTVKRAPRIVQTLGLEWLWRIKEEPHLWKRYSTDAWVLLRLLFTRVLPLAVRSRRDRHRTASEGWPLSIKATQGADTVILACAGDAVAANIDCAIGCFHEALALRKARIVVNLSEIRILDARFLGLILMARKCALAQGAALRVAGVRPSTERLLRLHEAAFLLSAEGNRSC